MASPFPTLSANMATSCISAATIGCQRNIDEAVKLKMPSSDAWSRSRSPRTLLRRHQDIIDG